MNSWTDTQRDTRDTKMGILDSPKLNNCVIEWFCVILNDLSYIICIHKPSLNGLVLYLTSLGKMNQNNLEWLYLISY